MFLKLNCIDRGCLLHIVHVANNILKVVTDVQGLPSQLTCVNVLADVALFYLLLEFDQLVLTVDGVENVRVE
jgi:hypothetical protein